METRIASGIVGVAILFVVAFFGHIAFGIGIFLAALIGMNEYYNAVENAGHKPIRPIGYVSCLPILVIGISGYFHRVDNYIDLFKSLNYFSFCIFSIVIFLFCFIIFLHDKYSLTDVALTVFGILYVAFLFSFVLLTRNMEHGEIFIWIIFIGAWVTDTFAYFSGFIFGRTKIIPAISPKKTVEGSIGGVLGCVLITMVFGYLANRFYFKQDIELYHFLILGLVNGVVSQLGDWGASAIKRYMNIKDYGKIMPGHGGVLDRFDSILFIAPTVYFYLTFFIL